MIELLNFLLCKEHYTSLRSYVPRSTDPTVQKLYAFLDALHLHAPQDVTWDEYEMYVLANLPNVTKHDKDNTEVAKLLLHRAKEINISTEIAHTTLEQLRKRQAAFEAASVMLDYSEGRKSQEDLSTALESLNVEEGSRSLDDFNLSDEGLEELFNASVLQPGLRWRLNCLNESLGSLRKGDFGFIFARPEVGKTTFLCSEVSHMMTQAEGPVLWINNEEQYNKVKMRFAQAYFGITRQEFLKDLKHWSARYDAEVKDKFIIPRDSIKSPKAVERLCESIKPGLILIDALDAFKEGFKADREDLQLGAAFSWARELAKEYAPTIGVTWADGTAEGIKWLTMGHVVNAKTEKQKPADWILGMGKSSDHNLENVRHLQISKNKLTQDPDSDPNQRHGRMDIIIDAERARFRDI